MAANSFFPRIRRLATEAVVGTPLHGFAKTCYHNLFVKARNYYRLGTTEPRGFWTVAPGPVDWTVVLHIGESEPYHVERVCGTYEVSALETLVSRLDDDDTFWEIGGGWGYFSLVLAPLAGTVVTFEPIAGRVESIRHAVERNDFDNVTVVPSAVDETLSLGRHPQPDVVLMDVDGGEYAALPVVLDAVETRPTVVVEVHEPETDLGDAVVPDAARGGDGSGCRWIADCFERRGYETTILDERSEYNRHLLAVP
jgi:precorrin-6B methylase 2